MAAVDDAYDAAIRLKNQGDLDGAAKSLEAILVEYPEHVLTYSALAVILQKLGRHDEAIFEHGQLFVSSRHFGHCSDGAVESQQAGEGRGAGG